MKNKLVFILLLVLTFSSCATRLEVVDTDEQLKVDMGYITGKFHDDIFYFLHFGNSSPYCILLEESTTKERVIFNFKKSDNYEIYSLPVGSYNVKSMYKVETNYDANTNTSDSRTYYLNVPEDLLFDFVVEESKVTYLGDIVIEPRGIWGWFFGLDKTIFEYNLDNAKSILAEEFSHIEEDDIISY